MNVPGARDAKGRARQIISNDPRAVTQTVFVRLSPGTAALLRAYAALRGQSVDEAARDIIARALIKGEPA
jgi:hypothetical protein